MIRRVRLGSFKRFRKQSFELDDSIVLAGPNNAGKSTLLQAIATWKFGLDHWLAQQRTAGRDFTPEQVRWLEMIRDHIAASVEMTVEDLDYAPFAEEGGRGRAVQVFGKGLGPLLDELNEVLAA